MWPTLRGAGWNRVSIDGRGRVFNNSSIQRLWRSVKYEDIYLHDFATGQELIRGLATDFVFYNEQRPHQAHAYQTSAEIYHHRS